MENLKIKVNNEAESKEAQELFFELGYKWFSGGNQVQHLKQSCSSSFGYLVAWSNGCFTNVIQCGCGDEDVKEITLPELRDLVVLKRNDVGDATHVDKIDPNFKYRFINNAWHVITENYQSWREDSFTNSEASLHIKPIEKTMKEYLDPKSDYKFIVTDKPFFDWIEVPEGAGIYAISKNWKENIFFARSGGDTLETFNTINKNNWHIESTLTLENLENSYSILWQRHTHPEELPFVDNNKPWAEQQMDRIMGRESLNDQYAEIEQVRQESQAWSNPPVGRCADAKPSQTTINAMNEADTLFSDAVNHPSHYASSSIECIDAMEAMLTPEQFIGYLRGNSFKYMWRYENKGGITDLEKAQWYLNKLISRIG